VFGRLRPRQDADAAARELTALLGTIAREWPDAEAGVRVDVAEYVRAFSAAEDRQQLFTMLAAVVLVLVVACVNVANLLLARAAQRAKEVAVRAAIGASRLRVVALFLTESVAIAAAGALAGLAVAWAGLRAFARVIADTSPPFWIQARLDARVLLFVVLATGLAAVVAGCLPALQAARADVGEVVKDAARGTSGFRVGRVSRALVVLEVALSCGLLIGAGMMVTTITRMRARDYGVDTHGTFAARLLLPARAADDPVAAARFHGRLLARLVDAGVARAALASALPVADGAPGQPIRVEGEAERADGPPPFALRVAVSPGYFAAVGARPPQGRDFDDRDAPGAPDVALVNGAFVRRHFAGAAPVGRRVELRLDGGTSRWVTVVGVAPDVFPGGVNARNVQEALYVPLAQWPSRRLAVAVRGRGEPLALARVVREAVASVDPDLAVTGVGTLASQIERRTWFLRVVGGAFGIFGLTALGLAALGLYAVMAAAVTRRTREMGVRMALGAPAGRILGLVLRQGAAQVGLGAALGLALGFGLSQLLRGLLFGVKPGDPAVTLAVVAVLAAAGALASLVPALRASRVDPMAALRAE
jgi:predicted permease